MILAIPTRGCQRGDSKFTPPVEIMISRALYVLIDAVHGRPSVSTYHSALGAGTLDRDLFWGAESACEFVRQQEVTELSVLEHSVEFCGGAVIDLPNQSLLLFGGDVIAEEPALRRVYLELLGLMWGGWQISWAHEGLADMARKLGVLRSPAVDACAIDAFEIPEEPIVDDAEWTEAIATVRWADGSCHAYPLAWEAESLLLWGDAFVDALESAPRHRLVRIQEIPSGGIHVDVGAKRIDYWLVGSVPGLVAMIAQRWPGWTCRWRQDDYEKHRALAGGSLRMNGPREGQCLEQLENLLVGDVGVNPMLNLFDAVDQEVQIRPMGAVSNSAHREGLLGRALAEFRRRRRSTGKSDSDLHN